MLIIMVLGNFELIVVEIESQKLKFEISVHIVRHVFVFDRSNSVLF